MLNGDAPRYTGIILILTIPDGSIIGGKVITETSTIAARWGTASDDHEFGFSLYDAALSLPENDDRYGKLLTRKYVNDTGLDKKLWELTDFMYLSPYKELYGFLQSVEKLHEHGSIPVKG